MPLNYVTFLTNVNFSNPENSFLQNEKFSKILWLFQGFPRPLELSFYVPIH